MRTHNNCVSVFTERHHDCRWKLDIHSKGM